MIMLQTGALDTLLPMHIVVRHDATIEATGPTIAKLGFQGPLAGLSLFEAFEVLRPAGAKTLSELSGQEARALKLRSKHGEPIEFKASFAPLGEDGGAVLNLSFGISMLDAIGRFNLTQADFSATDMTVEMLFLAETKSLAMREWRKMTERLSSAKSQAERHANTDALTGIGNRRALDRIVQDLISQRRAFGLVLVDLDHFKPVNDQYGHEAGDHVLKEFARLLTSGSRDSDDVVRLGGDEFAVVLKDRADSLAILTICQRLVAKLNRPMHFKGATIKIGASVGATSSLLYAAPDQARMMKDADQALYASKDAGRGVMSLVTPSGITTLPSTRDIQGQQSNKKYTP